MPKPASQTSSSENLTYSDLTTPQRKLVDLWFDNHKLSKKESSNPFRIHFKEASERAESHLIINFLTQICDAQSVLLGATEEQRSIFAEEIANGIVHQLISNSIKFHDNHDGYADKLKSDARTSGLDYEAIVINSKFISKVIEGNGDNFLNYLKRHTKELILDNFDEQRVIKQIANQICYSKLLQLKPGNERFVAFKIEPPESVQKFLKNKKEKSGIELNNSKQWEAVNKLVKNPDISQFKKTDKAMPIILSLLLLVAASMAFVSPSLDFSSAIFFELMTLSGAYVIYQNISSSLHVEPKQKKQFEKLLEKYKADFFKGQSTCLSWKKSDPAEKKSQSATTSMDKSFDSVSQSKTDFSSTSKFLVKFSADEELPVKNREKTRVIDEKAGMVPNLFFDEREQFFNREIEGEKFKLIREKVAGKETNRYFCISKKDFDSYEKVDQNQILEHLQDLEGGRDKRRDAKGKESDHRDKINLVSGRRLFKKPMEIPPAFNLPEEAELFAYSSEILTHQQQDRLPKTSTSNPSASSHKLLTTKERT